MAVQLQRDFHEHEAPTIPHVEWRSAIVRYTRGSASDIRLFPDETRGQVLAQVYRGDMIQICLTYEKDNWRVCRCGHITGWIDTSTVKLLMRDLYDPASEEPTQPVEPVRQPQAAHPASPARAAAAAAAQPVAERRTLVQRLIGFFNKKQD